MAVGLAFGAVLLLYQAAGIDGNPNLVIPIGASIGITRFDVHQPRHVQTRHYIHSNPSNLNVFEIGVVGNKHRSYLSG